MKSPMAVAIKACQIPSASDDISTAPCSEDKWENVRMIPKMVPSSPISGATRVAKARTPRYGQANEPLPRRGLPRRIRELRQVRGNQRPDQCL